MMQDAYERYSDDIAVIALDPTDDSLTDIRQFQSEMGLTFNVAKDPTSLSRAFNVTGYPTSVLVDRYGVITLINPGAIISEREWDSIFEHFTAENYEQKLIADYSEIVGNRILQTQLHNFIHTSDNFHFAVCRNTP